ncbi:MAG: LamG domain-containing protein, partial [Armatimonadota bacterium]
WTAAQPAAGDVTQAQLDAVRDNEALTALRLMKAQSLPAAHMRDGGIDALTDANRIATATNALLTDGVYTNDSYTKCLLHFDGDDAATEFTDATGRAWTAVNQAQLDTAEKKFGTAGLLLDGVGDVISTPRTADMILADHDFTIECWAYLDKAGMTGYDCIAQCTGGADDWSTDDGYEWALIIYDADQKLYFSTNNGGSAAAAAISTSPIDIDGGWHHFAAVNNGGTVTLYVDGAAVGSGALAGGAVTTLSAGAPRIYIGDDLQDPAEHSWKGWIDEFRMSVGVARWTDAFTPEAAAYPGATDMTLISTALTAEAQPATARVLLLGGMAEIVNTDIKACVSRDGGTTWTEAVLVDEGAYDETTRIFAATVDLSGQPSGTAMQWKITSHNAVLAQVKGVRLWWW